MKNILVLGAGRVARPAVQYLLEQSEFRVTVADLEAGRAEAVVKDHPNSRAVVANLSRRPEMDALVGDADVVISLLPPDCHPAVAEVCVDRRRPLLTTSYVSPAMRSLDERAQKAGVLLLNEMGLDPGIDHMSAKQVINRVRGGGGRIRAFTSACGGLPAPEANDNPWGYKFSWSPLGVLRACGASARFRRDGAIVEQPSGTIFDHPDLMEIEGVGTLESYPNRDSLAYADLYDIPEAQSIQRATLRYPGWCRTMQAVMAAGFLDATPRSWPEGTRLADFTRSLLPDSTPGSVRAALARRLGLSEDADPLRCMEWLGLFGGDPVPLRQGSPLEVLAARMQTRMTFQPGERDMIALRHVFRVEKPDGSCEQITATLT
ncbi:MAG: saccharopine dehydrogenase NADP-binding domain-containing protein, partial [Phycisphaerae bacterium]|nr:saccharopine dehydrogenase NADP-binding domain-containing protein [Phycisphaerae bacterium]